MVQLAGQAMIHHLKRTSSSPADLAYPRGVPVRVLVVDDHEMVAEGVAAMIDAEPDLGVVAQAGTADEAVEKAAACKPDVVLIDFGLPDRDGIVTSREIRAVAPDAEFVMMTASLEHPIVADAMEAGFSGFVVKSSGINELLTAVRAAAAGEVHFSAAALHTLVRSHRPPPPTEALSARELEVLRAIAAGLGTGEIAAELFISQHTVRNHVRRILTKLDAHSKLEAVVIATKAGVVELTRP
jgi:two-component system nitrate/nitrite response regulator NarL